MRHVRQCRSGARELLGGSGGRARIRGAAQTLVNAGSSSDLIRSLREQAQINRALGEQLRLEHTGVSGPTLIKVFDESGVFVRNATKLEVHRDGLHHRTAILLVRDHRGRAVYRSGDMESASGAERVFIEYERDPEVRKQIDHWF